MPVCTCCKIEKTEEEFYKSGTRVQTQCKECIKAKVRKHLKENKERICADRRKKYAEDEAHREKVRKRNAEWKSQHPDYDKEAYKLDCEYHRERARAWYNENKERAQRRSREHYHANKSSRRNYSKRYHFRMYHGEFGLLKQLRMKLSKLIGVSLRNANYTKRSRTHQLLGASYQEVMDWLGPKPCPDAHIDHICPCSQAQNQDELERLQHYWNLRWLSPAENLSKCAGWTQEGAEMCEILLGRKWQD